MPEIELTTVDLDAAGPGEITIEERDRADGFVDPELRRRFAVTRAAVRAVLGRRLGVAAGELAISVDPGGKPRVAGVEFSISHSGRHLVIATGADPVGVDVETRRPESAGKLAQRFFAAEDAARVVRAADPAGEFRRQWVAKEAALKVTGAGLASRLESARCREVDGAIVAVQTVDGDYAIREFHLPDGTPGAVAVAGAEPAKLIWRPLLALS